jgi:hypothetical protein
MKRGVFIRVSGPCGGEASRSNIFKTESTEKLLKSRKKGTRSYDRNANLLKISPEIKQH